MKILDRYITKNFLTGYVISFCVLIGLRIIIDLFVNLDEFTEHADLGTFVVLRNIFTYYGLNVTLYFRDFAGMITVLAAAFSIGRMVKSNELVAVMASGVSLKRIISPVILLSLLLTGLLALDQEVIIPRIAGKLVRSHDDLPGEVSYDVWFIGDEKGSLICSRKFDVDSSTLHNPTILLRSRGNDSSVVSVGSQDWEFAGWIYAEKARYNEAEQIWELVDGRVIRRGSLEGVKKKSFYESDIRPRDIPAMLKAEFKGLLSSSQLAELAKRRTKLKDLAQLYSQKHFRITDPVINFTMLLISLPLLVCRDPKSMKSAIMLSFLLTGACFLTTFISKMLATEVFFERVIPEFWAWLPVFIFAPIAIFELDSMKT